VLALILVSAIENRYWSRRVLLRFLYAGILEAPEMQFDLSDIFFILVVLTIAIAIINGSGGGGHRAPVRI